jgi:hypothetical protein
MLGSPGVVNEDALVRYAVARFATVLINMLVLPRMAPLVVRSHGDIGREGAGAFEVRFTADGKGNLLQAPSFDPKTDTLRLPTFLERDELGRTARRITADEATWDEEARVWGLRNGRVMSPQASGVGTTAVLVGEPLDRYPTDLGPDVLKMRRYREYATMLSLRQIRQMLGSPGVVNEDALVRYAVARFATVLINMLVLNRPTCSATASSAREARSRPCWEL